jgi:hypothetical protein
MVGMSGSRKEINAGLADPKLQARLAEFGGVTMAITPAEYGKLLAEETEKCARVSMCPTRRSAAGH